RPPLTSEARQSPGISGAITLGKPVARDGRYVVPVILTLDEASQTPQALALRVRFVGGVADASIRRAGAAKDVETSFENAPQSHDALSYLVSFDQKRGGLSLSGS